MKTYSRVFAEVNLDAVAYNMEQMHRNLSPGTSVIAVVKTDGYGHGAVPIARLVEGYDYVWGFAVATAEEALILRNHDITKPILILGYVFPEHYQVLLDQGIRPTVFRMDTAAQLSEEAVKSNEPMKIHVKVDTGMSRIGFPDTKESIEQIKQIAAMPNLIIEGIFTHFARADEKDKESVHEQIRRFSDFTEQLEEAGVAIPLKHCSNSAGIIELPDANMDAVRAGISIYGLYPSDEVERNTVRLKPVLSLYSRVVYVKELPAGVGISYGSTFVTERRTVVATIPVGYGDGYPRTLSNKGEVLIRGRRAKILGRICMDQFMVDVTKIGGVTPGDLVTMIGTDGGEEISVGELSGLSGRFHYEFVCDLGKRIPRVYKEHGRTVETRDNFEE